MQVQAENQSRGACSPVNGSWVCRFRDFPDEKVNTVASRLPKVNDPTTEKAPSLSKTEYNRLNDGNEVTL
jgi:hypothetical protein